MVIHAIFDRQRAELADHFDEALDGRVKHQLAKLGRGSGRVAADAVFREAAPIVLPAVGARLRVIPMNDAGELLLDDYHGLLNERTKFVALSHVSNALGTINPIKEMIEPGNVVAADFQCRGEAKSGQSGGRADPGEGRGQVQMA